MYDYSKIDKKVEKIIKEVCIYMKSLNTTFIWDEIKKAYLFARDAHEWQIRKSGQYYINHPVEATLILISLKPDISTIQACLLHDVIEDTEKTAEEIKEIFWDEVELLCKWMEKLSKIRYRWEERSIWSLRKMFIAMADDLRVIFIKLSDRLHNMRTLKFHPSIEKRQRIALETLNIYAPIADRLWLFNIKNFLEEECLKTLKYNDYKKIKEELRELETKSSDFVNNVKKEIQGHLDWKIQNFEVDYRIKSVYSIYKKLQKKWLANVNDLYDLYWIRIMVETESDCYKVLWIIHNAWTPLPSRFKDYIALPKPNWYKSLHTTVMWLLKQFRKQPTEIQIKTYWMKEYSDIWVAAHYEYKEKWSDIAQDIYWVNELKELTQNVWDNDFFWSLKIDVFKDRIFVFTPKWDFINLPAWSTVIDFAYYLHTDLWNHISLAKVNWKIYPLDKELHNWDVVEIIIDKHKKPNPFWISFVKTLKAKTNIKSYLKKENKEIYRERWKDIMNKYLEKYELWTFDKDYSLLKVIDWKELSLDERFQLLEQVWNFSLTPWTLFRRILRSNKNLTTKKIEISKKHKHKFDKEIIIDNLNKHNIIIWSEEWLEYRLWHCCDKWIPNEIVAHINNKWVITIHNRKCETLEKVNRNRLLPAYVKWTENDNLVVSLEIILKNKFWVLKDLTETIFSMNIEVDEISSEKVWLNNVKLTLKIIVLDYEYLIVDRLIERLKIHFWDDFIETKILKMEKQ